jgi:hypothetical protein
VIALVGFLRYRRHQSLAEIHQGLHERGLSIGERTVLNLLARYEELVTLHMTDRERLQPLVQKQGSLILAVDGLKPDVGHEVLWVVRDCVSGELLLARPLLSEREADLVALLKEVQEMFSVPIRGVISDGQKSIRNAVATAFPDTPHQLCQFHYLREAAKPVYEADRHAKKELKKPRAAFFSGIAAPPKRVSSVPNFYENDIAHGEFCADSRSVFVAEEGNMLIEVKNFSLAERRLLASMSMLVVIMRLRENQSNGATVSVPAPRQPPAQVGVTVHRDHWLATPEHGCAQVPHHPDHHGPCQGIQFCFITVYHSRKTSVCKHLSKRPNLRYHVQPLAYQRQHRRLICTQRDQHMGDEWRYRTALRLSSGAQHGQR